MIKEIIEKVNGEIIRSEEKFCDRCGVEKATDTRRRNTWDFEVEGYGGNFIIKHEHLCWSCYSGVKDLINEYFAITESNGDDKQFFISDVSKGTPFHIKELSKELNKQLVELRKWIGDANNWNDHIDYMIEVLQNSRLEGLK